MSSGRVVGCWLKVCFSVFGIDVERAEGISYRGRKGSMVVSIILFDRLAIEKADGVRSTEYSRRSGCINVAHVCMEQ